MKTLHAKQIHTFSRTSVIFWVVLSFAFVLRICHISSIPTGINQDEAMLAVDAWALSKYGTDRLGMRLPVLFTAWGFAQMGVLSSYVTIPFIKVFGFNTFAVRFPMALISTLGIAALYHIAKRMFPTYLALGIMILAAINPWHFMQSRWALEANLFPHIFLFGLYFLLLGFEKRNYLYLSMVFFGLTLYCYGVAVYTTPVFLLLYAAWCLWKKRFRLKEVILSVLAFLAIALPELLTVATNLFGWGTIETPLFTIPYFSQTVRGDDILLLNFSWQQLYQNARAIWSQVFLQRPDWLHNAIPEYGPMYPISLPFVLLGILRLIVRVFQRDGGSMEEGETGKGNCKTTEVALLVMLIMSLWSGLITRQVNINRINIIFYPLIICCGYGVYTFGELVGRLGRPFGAASLSVGAPRFGNAQKEADRDRCKTGVKPSVIAVAAVCLLYGAWAVSFLGCYFIEFPHAIRRQFNADFVEIVQEADVLETYDTLYITVNMGWNSGKQMAEILTQYACAIDPAYSQGRTDESRGRQLPPYEERYLFMKATDMAAAMEQEMNALETSSPENLYIFYRGELGTLPEGYVTILENESYVAVEVAE